MKLASELQTVQSDYVREYVENKFAELIERAAKNGEHHVQLEISEENYNEYMHRNTLLYKVKTVLEEYGYKVHLDRAGMSKNRKTGAYIGYKYFLRITW